MAEKDTAKKTKNKFYDIAKATPLYTVEKTFGVKFGENPDDDWTETLYKKKSGEFFVYGKGGKNTPYSTTENGVLEGGARYDIWTQSNYNTARNWVHSNCPEMQEEIFMIDEEDKTKVTSMALTKKARMNLKRKARDENTNVSSLVNEWAEKLYD